MRLTEQEWSHITQSVRGGTYLLTPQLADRIEETMRSGFRQGPINAEELQVWGATAFGLTETPYRLVDALSCVMETNVDITIQLADYVTEKAKTCIIAIGDVGQNEIYQGPVDEELMATAIMRALWKAEHDR